MCDGGGVGRIGCWTWIQEFLGVFTRACLNTKKGSTISIQCKFLI